MKEMSIDASILSLRPIRNGEIRELKFYLKYLREYIGLDFDGKNESEYLTKDDYFNIIKNMLFKLDVARISKAMSDMQKAAENKLISEGTFRWLNNNPRACNFAFEMVSRKLSLTTLEHGVNQRRLMDEKPDNERITSNTYDCFSKKYTQALNNAADFSEKEDTHNLNERIDDNQRAENIVSAELLDLDVEIKCGENPFLINNFTTKAERRLKILIEFDNMNLSLREKHHYADVIRKKWIIQYRSFPEPFYWLNKKDTSQCLWAWRYLQKKKIIPVGLEFTSHDDIYDSIHTVFDLWSSEKNFFSEDSRQFLEKMKKSWIQKKHSDGTKKSKQNTVTINAKNRKGLDMLAKHMDGDINDVLSMFISFMNGQSNKS
ncbi:hypothetical protein [Budvicia aquatica]|uniref:Uncharacterized protein n=1 Tax=Budvicia aquatica TaxID=82979 RepID=A0A2C6DJ71_9GAMM|nr:hypothetical protein [Budvicia aquatica]PHI28783.1 hypothetical protein CRN84_05355 [Budvicia aquatica]PHI31574.1 hypothetical protein CRN84_20655 [Budvicia aquatica]VFS46841.1 Uncharacterised protein [Budvicia aquatica]VFS52094.1 Uncharacterised protein [Budvicia aquatica]